MADGLSFLANSRAFGDFALQGDHGFPLLAERRVQECRIGLGKSVRWTLRLFRPRRQSDQISSAVNVMIGPAGGPWRRE
jgi:hypothetical protein